MFSLLWGDGEKRIIMFLVFFLIGGFRRREYRENRVINREDRNVEVFS